MDEKTALFQMLVRLADDHLILGHRVSEWCGHAPLLEEDLALANMALDLIGQARALYAYAGNVEGKGRDEDALAYLRADRDYCNLLLVERPNGDFAQTMLRQLYFAAFMEPFWQATETSSDPTLAGIAGKARKEAAYHVRHSAEWVIRLGDGTEESAERMAAAVDALHCFTDEMFQTDDVTDLLASANIIPDPASLKNRWEMTLRPVFQAADLLWPDPDWMQSGGRDGLHGEEFGFLLAELQYMQRTYPGVQW